MQETSNKRKCEVCGYYRAEVREVNGKLLCSTCYTQELYGISPLQNNSITSDTATLFADITNTLGKKNADYAGNRGTFFNFEYSAQIGNGTVEQGIMFRLADKISRLSNLLVREAVVSEESIDDTIKDAIGYLAILYSYRIYKNSRG